MAPKIKLQRIGTSKQPKYRLIVQEAKQKLGGSVVEILGIYHPRQTPTLFEVKSDKVLEWIRKGAQPTERVRTLLGKAGILPAVDFSQRIKRKTKKAKEAGEAAAPAPAAPAAPAAAPEEKKEAAA